MNGRTARLLRRAAAKAAPRPRYRGEECQTVRFGYLALKRSWRAYTRVQRTDARIDLADYLVSGTRRIP